MTVGLASAGKFKWSKVLPYVIAQYLGAFLAAALVFALYHDALDQIDGGIHLVHGDNATADIFSCFPSPEVTTQTCLLDQVVSTAVLLIAICAIVDPHNMADSKSNSPLLIGLSVSACMYAFSYNCGNPLNPARDFAPRLFTALCGWGVEVFSFRDFDWFWVPVVGPHIGGVVGVWVYKLVIENHWSERSFISTDDGDIEDDHKGKRRLLRKNSRIVADDLIS